MSHCQATRLSDRGVLRVSGADAHKLLQGVITNDLNKTKESGAVHAALLSPQGKILFDFFVATADGGFLLDVARDQAAALAKRLGLYRLRAQAEITEEPTFDVFAMWGGTPQLREDAIVYADPRLPELGTRVLLPGDVGVTGLGCTEAPEENYHAMRIRLGVPEGGRDYAFGDTFPHEALFDQLGGVDFKKGCFVGQEVVSRMQHRGTTRKRVIPVEGDGPLQSGSNIEAGGVPLGTIGSVSGTAGLALLRLDRAEKAAASATPLQAGDVTVTLRRPTFAQFDVPTPLPA